LSCYIYSLVITSSRLSGYHFIPDGFPRHNIFWGRNKKSGAEAAGSCRKLLNQTPFKTGRYNAAPFRSNQGAAHYNSRLFATNMHLNKMINTAFEDYNGVLCQALIDILEPKTSAINKLTLGEHTIYNYLGTRLAGQPIYHLSYEMQHLTWHTANDFRNKLRLLPDILRCPLVVRVIFELRDRVKVPKRHPGIRKTRRKPCAHSINGSSHALGQR